MSFVEIFPEKLVNSGALFCSRSVRRWKERLNNVKDEPNAVLKEDTVVKMESTSPSKRPVRVTRLKQKLVEEEDDYFEGQEKVTEPSRKKRRLYVDREKVQYATELIENKLSNKEMSLLLEMSIACVRKLKTKILDGTVEELIDNSEEHYSNLEKAKEEIKMDPDADPLQFIDTMYEREPSASTSSFSHERKPKVILSERDMFIARLLRENNIRTMDIAKMMQISERSVTRLLAKAKDSLKTEYEADVVEEVERLLAAKDEILNELVPQDLCLIPGSEAKACGDESKRQLGTNLLAMNVKIKDVAKMLDVSERTVRRWKTTASGENDGGHPVFNNLLETKQEATQEDIIFEEIVECIE